VEDVLALAFGN